MNVQIIKRVSKKTNKEYECLQITIGDWQGLMFLDKYQLMYVKDQLNKVLAQKALDQDNPKVMGKDEVNASLFE